MWLVTVRYGQMHHISSFKSNTPDFKIGDQVVIESDRGEEVGQVIDEPEKLPYDLTNVDLNRIVRKVTTADEEKINRIQEEKTVEEFKFCQKKIRELNLPMKLVNVEHLFGGSKIIFYFVADGRVDFRELVKNLAREYRTRIEMKQIGVRDEAKLLADYEHCGRELCCRAFMRELEPVTMKMAKSQKTTLDPAKISGRCGRLMCCLGFENETYSELKKKVPKKGRKVETKYGVGEVLDYDILQQNVTVEFGEGERKKLHVEDTKVIRREEKEEEEEKKGERGGLENF